MVSLGILREAVEILEVKFFPEDVHAISFGRYPAMKEHDRKTVLLVNGYPIARWDILGKRLADPDPRAEQPPTCASEESVVWSTSENPADVLHDEILDADRRVRMMSHLNQESHTNEIILYLGNIAKAEVKAMRAHERRILIDGSGYSPAERAIPGAEKVWKEASGNNYRRWWVFVDTVNHFITGWVDTYDYGFHLSWEQGILYIHAPDFVKEGRVKKQVTKHQNKSQVNQQRR